MQNRRRTLVAGALMAVGLGGCVGKIGSSGPGADALGGPGGPGTPGGAGSSSGSGGPGPASGDCTTPRVGPERIHRLTPKEYTNSLRALLGSDALEPVLDADREPIATLDAVRKWYNAADAAVPSMLSWLAGYGSCDPESDQACAKQLYEAFAERAFRRPLTDEEREWLESSWAALPARASNVQRLEVMGELVLQAPQFLYSYAEGTPAGAVNVLDGYARAERLAYFLWDAPPDAELLAAAAGGELSAREGMRVHAERLLADERAKPVLRAFLAEWLELDGATILPSLEETPKDPALFPELDGVLRQSMRRELEAFMDHVMFEADGSLTELFTSTRAYVNAPLAKLYGVKGPASADEWAWVDLKPTERAGMLTRAGFLTVHASQNVTSPIRRGVYLLKEVLCVNMPSPPANVDNTPVEVTGGEIKTVRQATLQRTGNPTCGACHTRINELGFAFEHYDAIGRWQDEEAPTGETVDASADLSKSGSSLQGTIDGALELSRRLAESPEVASCATERWFQVALRRSPVELDACSVQQVQAKTSETRSIRELLLAMVESDAFLHVSHGE
ncbi:MAG: Cellulose-binding domain protein [Polyangiaceae bacterium]|nr:Cellulose-binding domain protein [Polyangiaceae bacterium]